jgi:NitT/TauT family transport system substrate-binding protein
MQPSLSRNHVLMLALGAAASPLLPAPARAQALPAVRIGAATADSFAEPYFAADAGFFTRAGLAAPISTFPGGGPIVQAAAANAVDVGIADPIALVNVVRAGVPMVYFAGAGLYSSDAPTTLLCVAAGSPLRTAKDLEGQTIAVANISSISTVAVKAWLEQGGADLTKVRIFELPQAEMPASLVRGTVTAAFMAETFITAERDRLRVFAKPYDTVGKQWLLSGWFASRDWLAHNADTAKRLTTAIYAAARWANGHHDETAVILSKQTGMDVARIRSIHRIQYATSLDARLIQPVLDAATKFKLLEAHVNAADLLTSGA